MNDQNDRTTIRVSDRAQVVLSALTSGEAPLFRTELSAYLAAAALALSKGIVPVAANELSGQTKWNRGSGAIGTWEALAALYVETSEPIRSLMGHAEAGLRFLEDRVDRGRTAAQIFDLD
jgi:hypothetical protein